MRNYFAQGVFLHHVGDNNGLFRALGKELVEHRLSSIIRILIADDFKGWRHRAQLLLQARPELQVIAEASDGFEAIRKAEVLEPDLILLDISLPRLNGIEAAWRIESPRLIAGLVRIVNDIGFAEEVAQDALVAALAQWPVSGCRGSRARG